MSVPGTDLFLCLHMFMPDTNGFLRKGTVIPRAPDYKHAGISLIGHSRCEVLHRLELVHAVKGFVAIVIGSASQIYQVPVEYIRPVTRRFHPAFE